MPIPTVAQSMPNTLTPAQLRRFYNTGLVRIRQAFSAADAAIMRQAIWQDLAVRYGARRPPRPDGKAWQPTPCGITRTPQVPMKRELSCTRRVNAPISNLEIFHLIV